MIACTVSPSQRLRGGTKRLNSLHIINEEREGQFTDALSGICPMDETRPAGTPFLLIPVELDAAPNKRKIKLRHSGDELLLNPLLFAVIREEQPELLRELSGLRSLSPTKQRRRHRPTHLGWNPVVGFACI